MRVGMVDWKRNKFCHRSKWVRTWEKVHGNNEWTRDFSTEHSHTWKVRLSFKYKQMLRGFFFFSSTWIDFNESFDLMWVCLECFEMGEEWNDARMYLNFVTKLTCMHYVFTYFQNVLEWMEMVKSKEFTLINWAMCITWLAQHQVCWHMKCHRERYFLSHFHRFWFEGLGGPLTPYFLANSFNLNLLWGRASQTFDHDTPAQNYINCYYGIIIPFSGIINFSPSIGGNPLDWTNLNCTIDYNY